MKNFYQTYKNYILGAVVIAVLFGAYIVLFRGDSATTQVLQTEQQNGVNAPVEGELFTTLLALRSIELSNGIFSNETFQSLRDFSQTISPQPVGRSNPFAPITVN